MPKFNNNNKMWTAFGLQLGLVWDLSFCIQACNLDLIKAISTNIYQKRLFSPSDSLILLYCKTVMLINVNRTRKKLKDKLFLIEDHNIQQTIMTFPE